MSYLKAIQLYESGQYTQPKSLGPVEYWEYVIALGLSGNREQWKKELKIFGQRNPGWEIKRYENMDRTVLLKHHFRHYIN